MEQGCKLFSEGETTRALSGLQQKGEDGDEESEREGKEHGPLLAAEGIVEEFGTCVRGRGQQVANHLALEELDLGNDFKGTFALAGDDALGEKVHGLLDEELLFDRYGARKALSSRRVPVNRR